MTMKRNAKHYFMFLWFGFVSAILIALAIYFYQEEIASSVILIVLVVFLSLPAGIAHLSLLIDLVSSYRYKLAPVLLLVFWPKVFVLALVFGPFIYLAYLSVLAQRK